MKAASAVKRGVPEPIPLVAQCQTPPMFFYSSVSQELSGVSQSLSIAGNYRVVLSKMLPQLHQALRVGSTSQRVLSGGGSN